MASSHARSLPLSFKDSSLSLERDYTGLYPQRAVAWQHLTMVRIAVISDVHSNLDALEAVIRDAGQVDDWWCLGDIVGYGPEPNEVISALQDLKATCIQGNHDECILHRGQIGWFHGAAREALEWTSRQLTDASWAFLQALPQSRAIEGVRLVHGSPRGPLSEYVTGGHIAAASFRLIEEAVCFIGHTHIASAFTQPAESLLSSAEPRGHQSMTRLNDGGRHMLNSGSVGQPRDGDPRASYGILDAESMQFTWLRVPYGIHRTQEKMLSAGLPRMLIDRLAEGW